MKTRRLVKKVTKSFHYGEKGFTLIELLIVVAILGILAAVILPNVGGFLRSGNLAAANSEVATVKTGAAAYYTSHNGTWAATSSALHGGAVNYIDRPTKTVYTLDATNGTIVTGVDGTAGTLIDATAYPGLTFNLSDQQWH